MLYSHRSAYSRMGHWRPFHMLIWRLYLRAQPVSGLHRPAMLLWRNYRKLWP